MTGTAVLCLGQDLPTVDGGEVAVHGPVLVDNLEGETEVAFVERQRDDTIDRELIEKDIC